MGWRVLVVEDEVRLAHLIARALREEGHGVAIALDGQRALELAAETSFDVIVLDLMLPRLDGLAVCRDLRAQGNETAILMLTARDAVPDRVAGLVAGADDYLVKPFAFEELIARVRALGRRTAAGGVLRAGDLVLDPTDRHAERGGQQLRLTSREFDLLEELARNLGRVLSRDHLLERVWGSDVDPASNIVDIYIHYLRDKVDRGRPPLIHTVRGVGYVLRAPHPAPLISQQASSS